MLTKHSFTQIGLFALLGAWVSGCTAAGDSLDGREGPGAALCPDGALSRDAAAGNLPEQEFEATVALSTVKGDYASLSEAYEGAWDATVKTDGAMEWKAAAEAEPVFPFGRLALPDRFRSGGRSGKRRGVFRAYGTDRPALCRRASWQQVGR